MTTGNTPASSAGMVAGAIATFLDDGFRLRHDTVSARRRLVASLCAVAVPLVDAGGVRVTQLVERAGAALWRGAQRTEQVGATVADEAVDAGREGARALRDAAPSRPGGPDARSGSPQDRRASEDAGGAVGADEDFLEMVEVIEVVEPGDLGVVDELDVDELDVDELDVDELDADELDEDGTDEDLLPEPPAVLTEAAEIGGDRGEVPEVVTEEVVSEEAVAQITGDAPERRTPRRGTSARPRSASRPVGRDRPREERREAASSGTRERRG